MENIIQIKNLSFDYIRESDEGSETIHAIRDVSLDIKEGSFTAVIGKNGSGKSTLAKNLNGLLLPTGGKILVNGWDTADEDHIWDIRQTAGMVFQNPDNQLVASIVEDDVAFGPENLGVPPEEIRTRVDQVLKAVDMYDFRTKAPHLLSGGQKQRVAIAGVLAMEPRCIIFDEPTAMLDPQGREEVMSIIRKLHEDGKTVILITHFMDEAAQADRIVIMDDGRVLADGSPDEVFSDEETMRRIRLDVPLAVDMAQKLRERGVPVPSDVTTQEKLVEFICQYK
ncbi:MAG: energy-coupling factor transporter ATPase [Clostridiales bacterium]|nr:energy-coupling factor transporter ATPase [Clostridiales bacterium]